MNKILKFILLALLSMSQAAQAAELPARYTNEVGMTFVLIPPGLHQMRSYSAASSPPVIFPPWHWVRFNKPFYLQSTEVTQKQWEQVMQGLSNDRLEKTQKGLTTPFTRFGPIKSGPNYPVHYMRIEYIRSFLGRLNTGLLVYRLPTEAEWEYAALAGATRPPSGQDLKYYANCWVDYPLVEERFIKNPKEAKLEPTHDADGFDDLAPVGSLLPNAWGLYDMLGNVYEFVTAYKPAITYPNSEQYLLNDPVPDEDYYDKFKYHGLKGGYFMSWPEYCNPFRREPFSLNYRDVGGRNAGFRLWLDVESVRKALAH